MNVGDLVKTIATPTRTGIIIKVYMHKLWETDTHGKVVNWKGVKPQPFAEVLWDKGEPTNIPQDYLEVINEGR